MEVIQLDLFGNHENVEAKDPLWILKNRPAPDPNSPIVVSFGGGTNSTAMLIAMVFKNLKPDLILFADTGGELPETYEWVNTFSGWLTNQGFPGITVVNRKQKEATQPRKSLINKWQISDKNFEFFSLSLYLGLLSNGYQYTGYSTLYDKCVLLKTLPSRTFNRGECSVSWKIDPQNDFVKQHYQDIFGRTKIRKLIGYHAGEVGRILNSKNNPYEDDNYRYEYPLIEWGLTQEHCISLIQSIGLGTPPKSSCFFCPNRKRPEVLKLKELHPDLYKAACFLEENFIRKDGGVCWAWAKLEMVGNR